MSYIVMECHPGYVILLDEEGRFLKAANLHYEVGQTISHPVMMHDEAFKQKKMIQFITSGAATIAACLLLFLGADYYQSYMAAYSSIYLSINPEVQIDLNKHGMAVRLTGTNEDGRTLLEGYNGKGKDKVTIADELIDRAIEMGFLSEGGRISFSIDTPDDVLFQEYGVELRSEITSYLDGRITVTIEIYDHHTAKPAADESVPSTETAVPTVVTPNPNKNQESAAPASTQDSTTDYDDTDYGPNNDGVTDYNDTDYGPNNDGVTDYQDTDYGPNNDGVTDYNDTDYGPNNDGVTDYQDTDYGPNNDGITNYSDTDYGANNNGTTDESNKDSEDDHDDNDEESDHSDSQYEENDNDEDSDEDNED